LNDWEDDPAAIAQNPAQVLILKEEGRKISLLLHYLISKKLAYSASHRY
jgi:hypothetical protein